MIASQTNLFAEISSGGLGFFFQNEDDKKITGLSVLSFDERNEEDHLLNALPSILENEGLLKNKFNKIFVSYAFDESVLTPALYYNEDENNDNLNLVFGDVHQGIVLTDHVAEKELYNTYRVAYDVHHEINNQFTEATFIHQYSLLIRQLEDSGNLLQLIFYQDKIIILLQTDSRLQIIRAFKYATSEDVLYHMLNVCKVFNADNPHVQLCGMIEKDSAVYRAVKKYFLNITFPGLPEELVYTEEIKALPGHFFNHLFAFALCV